MSKNYDNWERLVTAVVRRERDKKMALSHSRDPSISSTSSSLDLSFSLTSGSDHHQSLVIRERNESPMDFVGLKTMLPDKQEVVWISNSLKFFLDKKTGKTCFLVGAGATNLDMSSVYGSEHKKFRYSEVAQLLDSWKQYIRARIKTNRLSPETLYSAYLVFGFSEKHAEPQAVKSTITIFYGEAYCYFKKQDQIVNFEAGNCRSDGWLETQLGDFYIDLDTAGEVMVELMDTSECSFSGLIVQGIEFRPLET
ncbi:hypothetical protein C2S52_015004 [Perilla frutescens var. hirtella]|uniref:Uncharacterized protein n=1 Tax=Perilla frutescens var. hirtella TaxID=608512 RepID=A0AAD4NZN6_PERFH|nr:hypothetical protein C2S52_015004 [Perilla frutescens var. hirtella]KAH6820871.1 hypothetical protein C2S53_010213 [Perilla frutescens var. hirtella]